MNRHDKFRSLNKIDETYDLVKEFLQWSYVYSESFGLVPPCFTKAFVLPSLNFSLNLMMHDVAMLGNFFSHLNAKMSTFYMTAYFFQA
jgi:hypothetical protein